MGVTKSGPDGQHKTWEANVGGSAFKATPSGNAYVWTVLRDRPRDLSDPLEQVKLWGLEMAGWGEMVCESFHQLNEEVRRLRIDVDHLKTEVATMKQHA
jgi:hypothetical protein